MHPAVVAIGLLITGAMFGLLGLFIAVPLISLALILVEELWVRPQEQGADTLVVRSTVDGSGGGRPRRHDNQAPMSTARS